MVCGILVPRPGIESYSWTAREGPPGTIGENKQSNFPLKILLLKVQHKPEFTTLHPSNGLCFLQNNTQVLWPGF